MNYPHLRRMAKIPKAMLSVAMIEEIDGEERPLVCFGAFEVTMRRGQPEFRSHHLTSAGMGGVGALCRRLAQLSEDRHIILGQPAIQGDFWDWQELLSTASLFVSSIRDSKPLQPSGLSLISVPTTMVSAISDRMDICSANQGTPFGAYRVAPERAQLLWLGYIASRSRPRICDSLFAAYQAWHTIERVRPLPF